MCQLKRIVSNFMMYILFVTPKNDSLDLIKPVVCGEFLAMATCGYSSYIGGPCGSSIQHHTNMQCALLSDCQGGVRVNLKALNVWDASLKTEAQLLLARAGVV